MSITARDISKVLGPVGSNRRLQTPVAEALGEHFTSSVYPQFTPAAARIVSHHLHRAALDNPDLKAIDVLNDLGSKFGLAPRKFEGHPSIERHLQEDHRLRSVIDTVKQLTKANLEAARGIESRSMTLLDLLRRIEDAADSESTEGLHQLIGECEHSTGTQPMGSGWGSKLKKFFKKVVAKSDKVAKLIKKHAAPELVNAVKDVAQRKLDERLDGMENQTLAKKIRQGQKIGTHLAKKHLKGSETGNVLFGTDVAEAEGSGLYEGRALIRAEPDGQEEEISDEEFMRAIAARRRKRAESQKKNPARGL